MRFRLTERENGKKKKTLNENAAFRIKWLPLISAAAAAAAASVSGAEPPRRSVWLIYMRSL